MKYGKVFVGKEVEEIWMRTNKVLKNVYGKPNVTNQTV